MADADHPARHHLVLALDLDDPDRAIVLARRLRPWFAVAKVGLELYSAGGPAVIERLRADGIDVFADLKLHDIPTTVRMAARVIGRLGARHLTVHCAGGVPMLLAGVEGFGEGADAGGHPSPVALGVTVLTSDPDSGREVLESRVGVLLAARCPAAVCSALDVARVKELAPGVIAVCPGIRPARSATHDQARVATPSGAIAAGADLLVLGRPVTESPRPEDAAAAVADEVLAATRLPRSPGAG